MNLHSNHKNPCSKIDAVGAGLCLVLTLAVYLLGVHPLVSRQSESQQRHRELQDQRKEAGNLAATLSRLRRELASVEQSLVDSPLRLQAVSAVNHRLAKITELASSQTLSLNEIQPGQATAGAHYDTVPITLSGSGRYRSIAAFMHRMHTTFADTGITAFSVGGNPATPDSPASFRLVLAWYAAPINRAPEK